MDLIDEADLIENLFDLANTLSEAQSKRKNASSLSHATFVRKPFEKQTHITIMALRTAGHEMLILGGTPKEEN